MMPTTSPALAPWQSLRLRLGNQTYGRDNLDALLELPERETLPLGALHTFLSDWFAPRPTMWLQTSGSTGTPKRVEARKEHMMQSAQMSCRYFGLGEADVALLCMDLRYIGAMMLVVRALVCGMRLVLRPPSSAPLSDPTLAAEGLTFAALVPLQVYHALETSAPLLGCIRQIIIGGAALPLTLRHRLAEYPNGIYATYGMTETLSHVALALLSRGAGALLYTPLPGVGVSLSERQTLVIDAPQIGVQALEVNDLAELVTQEDAPDAAPRFRLLGRADLVINTGGVKVSAEALEELLGQALRLPLAISWQPSARFGQSIVLLLEAPSECEAELRARCAEVFASLPPYHRPRAVRLLPSLPRLGSGKLDRQRLLALASKS